MHGRDALATRGVQRGASWAPVATAPCARSSKERPVLRVAPGDLLSGTIDQSVDAMIESWTQRRSANTVDHVAHILRDSRPSIECTVAR